MKKPKINWPTILGCIGFIGIASAWAVTSNITADNKTEIKETKKDVSDLKTIVTEQQVLSTQQYSINQSLVELLKKKR